MYPNIPSLMPEVGASSIFSVQLEIRSLLILFGCLIIIFESGFSVEMSRGNLTSTP